MTLPLPADGKGVGPGTDNSGSWGPMLRDYVLNLEARLAAYESSLPVFPSPAYPGLGDSSHVFAGADATGFDNYSVLQDMIADHQGKAHGILIGNGTFRVVVPAGQKLDQQPDKTKAPVGIYGFGTAAGNHNLGGGPCLLYDGPAGGTLLSSLVTGQNIPSAFVTGVHLRGYGAKCGLLREMGPVTTSAAKPDSGSEVERVWYANATLGAVKIDGDGVTFMDFARSRFDAIGGPAVSIRAISDTDVEFSNIYYDNNSPPAGSAPSCFLYVDGSALGANATVMVHCRSLKLEAQADLGDLAVGVNTDYATADPADKRGMIVYRINPAQQRMQFNLTADKIRTSAAAARASYSLVLPVGGTEAQRRARIGVAGRNWRGFTGTGVDATGDWLPIGGIPDADKAHILNGAGDGHYPEVRFWPGGDNLFADEDPTAYTLV